MFLIVTRSFPPEVGGMQVLMAGLSKSLLDHGPVKVLTYDMPNSETYDSKSPFFNTVTSNSYFFYFKLLKLNLIL